MYYSGIGKTNFFKSVDNRSKDRKKKFVFFGHMSFFFLFAMVSIQYTNIPEQLQLMTGDCDHFRLPHHTVCLFWVHKLFFSFLLWFLFNTPIYLNSYSWWPMTVIIFGYLIITQFGQEVIFLLIMSLFIES